jgi:hypothetical protein
VAFRAEIEIAVKGAQELKRLQNEIRRNADALDSFNRDLSGIANLLPRSFNNINKVLSEAAANFNKVALGTEDASTAAQNYYQANKNLNNALRERVKLLDDIQRAERGAVLSNIKTSRAAREASGFGAFSSSIDTPTQKSIRRNREKKGLATAAAETAAAVQKLTERQEEFTTRTDAAAQASARQTAAFLRQKRVALEVAKINAAAPTAQLLLAPAAPGAPAMSGGARRRITGAVERLGGARVEDEAARALRFAQASGEQIRPLSQIQSLFAGIAGEAAKLQRIKALPDSRMLNASVRGIQQLEKTEDSLNRERQESATRLKEIDRLEEGRLRRARKLQARQQYMDGETPPATQTTRARGGNGRVGGAISSALIGGGFPLLFGQGPSAAAGGAVGGLAGGLLGGGFGFALSIVGTAIGDAVTKAEELDTALTRVNSSVKGVGISSREVDTLAKSLGIAKDEAVKLLDQFTQFESSRVRLALAFQFSGKAADVFAPLEAAKDEEGILQAIVASRTTLGNQKAKELVTQLALNGGARAQLALQEALLRAKEREAIEDKKRVTLQDRLLAAAAFVSDQPVQIDPAVFGKERAAAQQAQFDKDRKQRKQDVADALKDSQDFFTQVDQLSTTYKEKDKKDKEQNNNALYNEQARQAEQLARNQIALDNAVFRNKMALADEEFAVRQRIAELQGRLAEAGAFGAQREVLALINATSSSQSDYFKQARDISNAIAQATQELKSANAMVDAQQAGVVQAGAGGMTQGRYMQGGIGPSGANQYGPHFDIKRSDGGYYSRTALDKYVQVNGRPLSSGVTVPGGEFGAPRSYGPHAGRDYAFGGQAAMTLTGGAKFISSKAGSYGDATAFMTPDGKVYKVIHGKFEGTTQAPTGQTVPQSFAKGQSQVIGAGGDVAVAQANETAQIQRKAKLLALLQQERDLKIQIAVAQGTEFLRNAQEQTMQIEREIEKRKIRNRLALEGVAPEIIEGELRVYDIIKQKEEKLNELTTALSRLTKTQQYATEITLQSALADLDKKDTTGSLTVAEQTLRGELQQRLTLLQEIKALEEGTPAVVAGARGVAAAQVQTPTEKIEGRIGALKTEITDLTSISNIAITAAEGIGNAFAQSFQGLISGTMTAKEALGSFFKSVADMFLEMAAQIIAKQITMIILQTILKALGAVGGGGGGGGNAASALGSNPNVAAYAPLAKGGTFGNGVAAFAKGGAFSNSIVSSPTLFKFADGGTTRTGLMGEAGPEAIMPLKRGSDGSLGVQATGLREAMGRPPGGANGSTVLNMSFQSTTINGTEYVSRDQLEAAMAATRRQAAKEGANRGMNMTLDKIQNSPSTRSRVGIR